ncbi:hypothetical protein [Spirosoma sp. 48-14]|uniref:hypothetical protein n=1 Tax=Spirosoma sp. 48-14 TaxID=1895854 RepID=UPI00095AA340|nr:hypothetical protein [Spirosoma sp. 48-14]OJW78423.1 MAG: hypothetical protein BGO59_30955 [Spirosoma sp. 48-14]
MERFKGWYQLQHDKHQKEKQRTAQIEQNRAKKAEEARLMREKKQAWKLYSDTVWKLTKAQPLHTLPNYDKRDFTTYQLDHIVSVTDGFRYGLPCDWIADISNLRIIEASANMIKGMKSEPEPLTKMLQRAKSSNSTISG